DLGLLPGCRHPPTTPPAAGDGFCRDLVHLPPVFLYLRPEGRSSQSAPTLPGSQPLLSCSQQVAHNRWIGTHISSQWAIFHIWNIPGQLSCPSPGGGLLVLGSVAGRTYWNRGGLVRPALPAGRVARPDQAGFVSVDDGVRPVAQRE